MRFWIKRRDSLSALGDGTIFDNIAPLDPLNAQGRFVRYSRLANGNCSNDNPGNPTPASVPCAIKLCRAGHGKPGDLHDLPVWDVTASMGIPAPVGKFRLSLDGTYINKYQYQRQKDGDYLNNLGLFTTDNGAITRWRHVLTLDWTIRLCGMPTLRRTSSPVTGMTVGARDVGNVETYDAQVAWRGIKNLQLVLGIRNMFDRESAGFRPGPDVPDRLRSPLWRSVRAARTTARSATHSNNSCICNNSRRGPQGPFFHARRGFCVGRFASVFCL